MCATEFVPANVFTPECVKRLSPSLLRVTPSRAPHAEADDGFSTQRFGAEAVLDYVVLWRADELCALRV